MNARTRECTLSTGTQTRREIRHSLGVCVSIVGARVAVESERRCERRWLYLISWELHDIDFNKHSPIYRSFWLAISVAIVLHFTLLFARCVAVHSLTLALSSLSLVHIRPIGFWSERRTPTERKWKKYQIQRINLIANLLRILLDGDATAYTSSIFQSANRLTRGHAHGKCSRSNRTSLY